MAQAAADLEALLSAHSREVHGLLLAITRNQALAEELTQEVFLIAFKKQMRPGPGMCLWLRDVARKLALKELRRKRPEPVDFQTLEFAGAAPEAAACASFEEELAALRKCLTELPETDQTLLASRYESQERLEVVAGKLSQSVGYLKQRLFRLRKRLAGCVRHRLGLSSESEEARA